MDAKDARSPNPVAKREGRSTSAKKPSLAGLAIGLGLLAIYFGSLICGYRTFSDIFSGFFCFYSLLTAPKGEPLKPRHYLWLVLGVFTFAALVVSTAGKQFPAVDGLIENPRFLVALWLLSSALGIGFWGFQRSRRRAAEAKPEPEPLMDASGRK